MKRRILLLLLGIPLLSGAQDTPLCRPFQVPPIPPIEEGVIRLSAREAEIRQKSLFILKGGAEIQQDGQRLLADILRYDRQEDRAEAEGEVRFQQDGLLITGRSAYFQLLKRRGRLKEARFWFAPRHARGQAREVRVKGAEARLKDASYTTCDGGDWYLRARHLHLDREKEEGSARHVWLRFKGIPLLYTPYLRFPLSDARKSGFLTPEFGSSETSGLHVGLPYYFNLAPNRDATLTPHLFSKRGLMLEGEFRYLNPTYRGTLGLAYLPGDRKADRDRSHLSLRHRGNLTPRLFTDVSIESVSDVRYFDDFGGSLESTSLTHLERRAEATYFGPFWSLRGMVQDFQTLDETVPPEERPYGRLPQFLFRAHRPWRDLEALLEAEWVHFQRSAGVTGERLDLKPALTFPLQRPYGFLTPSLKLRLTAYHLNHVAPGQPTSPTRAVPIFSLDGGLYLERPWTFRNRRLLQVLEPRLFYLHVPFRDQSDIPIFDSAPLDLSFAQMFQDNRFSGGDRQGDADQLSAVLTARWLEKGSGRERLRAGIGQIFYFRDRRVTLPGEPEDTRGVSDLLAEVNARITSPLSLRAGWQWDPEEGRTDEGLLQLHYQPGEKRIFNAGYRFFRPDVKQTDISFFWPLSSAWSAVGRWNYSLEEGRTLEALAGFEYRSCCWTLRLVGRHYIRALGETTNDMVYAQLELKGLTRLGHRVEDILEQGILGY
ncbi:MAG: LPS-assembly protein LptD, partial [Gammaproteobacteria bacterium]